MTKNFEIIGNPSSALPNYFLACCGEARVGSTNGYFGPGYHLSIHLPSLLNGDDHDDAQIDQLTGFLQTEDLKKIYAWFKTYLPRCMKCIPARRKNTFLRGVLSAWENDKMN